MALPLEALYFPFAAFVAALRRSTTVFGPVLALLAGKKALGSNTCDSGIANAWGISIGEVSNPTELSEYLAAPYIVFKVDVGLIG